jgi:hypothetical protein
MSQDIEIQQLLTNALVTHDNQRPRSQQKVLGPSSIGSCTRQVWHASHNTPVTNYTDGLAAILGTAIHATIAEAIALEDPFGEDFLIELPVFSEALGRKGHVDLFIKSRGLVIDWKTTKKKSMRYFPYDNQRMQVQAYGVLMEDSGYTVKEVALCAIPRDGEMKDIKVHREAYDRELGLSGLNWLEKVENMVLKPAPEKTIKYCSAWCKFYDATGVVGCPSLQ